MLILNAADVRRALPMREAIECMKLAYAALSQGRAIVPERIHLDIARHDAVGLIMPCFVDDDEGAYATKIVSLYGGNPARGLARIQAAVLACDPATGQPAALLDGAMLTAIRTAAGVGAATDLLAPPDADTAALFGTGVQARHQLEAVCTARAIQTAWIFDVFPDAAARFCDEMAGQGPIPADLRPADAPADAIRDAAIVTCATTASTPVFDDADLMPGAHVNAIGSYQPHVQELPPATVARALLVVDSREHALAETGDLIIPINQGLFTADHIHAEIGEIVTGHRTARTAADQITLFKSVGVAVQDAFAARLARRNADTQSLGQRVKW